MIQSLPRRAGLALAASVLVAACTATTGCGRPPPGNPDPDNRQLHALATDPVFTGLPTGAVRTGWQENPARYRGSTLFGGGWGGPGVTLTFTSAGAVRDVFGFYAGRASRTGWAAMPGKTLSNGLVWSWSKRIRGRQATLALQPKFDIHSVDVTATGTTHGYTLAGSTW